MKIEADSFVRDKKHAASGIRDALTFIKKIGTGELHFSSGTYYLEDDITIETGSVAHDDGCGDIHTKQCHLVLEDLEGVRLVGAMDEQGRPATVLMGCHDNPIQTRLPSLIWAMNCKGLTLENLTFGRTPQTAWQGMVERIEEGRIYVRMDAGQELPEETGAYCMNRFDWKERRLMGESLTFGFGYEKRFRKVGPETLCLEDGALAEKVAPGEGLSWHQSGLTDFLLFFGGCDDLQLKNIRILNANGFAILTENCEGIYANHLVMKPEKGAFFTGPRDGWKIYRCSGRILLEHCEWDGFRMDAQNVHSNFFLPEQMLDDRHMIFRCKYAPIPLKKGTSIRFRQADKEYYGRIGDWKVLEGCMEENRQSLDTSAGMIVPGVKNHITRYWVELEQPLPEAVQDPVCRWMAEPLCWEPTEYICRHSIMRNIAGAGHLIRCRHVTLEDNLYENLMCAGILIGAEFGTHCEGSHGRDVTIRNNRFRNIGFKPRYGNYGCAAIAVKSQGFCGPVNETIRIEHNVFEQCHCAIELNDVRDVIIRGNEYRDITHRYIIEEKSVERNTIECKEDPYDEKRAVDQTPDQNIWRL